MEKNETPKNLALLTADEVTLSILEVDAEGVRIKLWPDVNAVRAHLEECCERMPGGLAGYSVRHLQAARLDDDVVEAMAELATLTGVGACRLVRDYNFTDTANRRYRYQAVFEIVYY